ncbi:IclR family transcriptional regulator C-terminal domain-containing protein [Pseudomonas sp. CM27]|uniref:IclR family transcriptional regulator C-terminal domain-containing protein n=1 Tax=Pseudomonas sp. CM27 TaxID=2738452 RepID=UPI001C49851C
MTIRDHRGKVTAAINLSGPDAVMDPEGTTEKFVALLHRATSRMSHAVPTVFAQSMMGTVQTA